MKAERRFRAFLICFIGVLLSVMAVMMRMGGSVNFQEFMSAGRVYDFEPSALREGSPSWRYDKEQKGFWLTSEKAVKFCRLDGRQRTWNFLYVNVSSLSTDTVDGTLKYYGVNKKKAAEQPITLVRGRNMIFLDGSVPMAKMSITLWNAQGEFIGISDMQIRTTPSWFTISHFLVLFTPILAACLGAFFSILSLWNRFYRRSRNKNRISVKFGLTGVLQDGMQIAGDYMGGRLGGRLSGAQRDSVRTLLFSLLFSWMVIGNVAGWLEDAQTRRYHVLVCVVLLLSVSFVSWEKPLKKQFWREPFMRSWLCIWFGFLLCDFFTERSPESVTGYVMLFGGMTLVFCWQNMEGPEQMLQSLMQSLEITYFISIAYCVIFRPKRPAIDYNGIFRSPEELAMYAVLMAAVFLAQTDKMIAEWIERRQSSRKEDPGGAVFALCMKNIFGLASSLFFLLRSGHTPGMAALGLIGVLYLPIAVVRVRGSVRRCGKLFACMTAAAAAAFVCVCLLHLGIKYVPGVLNLDVTYERETLLTDLEGEEKQMFLLQNPEGLKGVKSKERAKLPVIWRNYARRLNLFGHSGKLKIFRRKILPYNAFLDLAFHHGLFILIPWTVYLCFVIGAGMKGAFRRKERRSVLPMFLGIAYLCFSFCSNTELPWRHPFWLCFYLSAGYLGGKSTKKHERMKRKEGLT